MLKSTQEIASWFKKVALVHETHGKALVKSSGLNKKKKTPMSSFEIGYVLFYIDWTHLLTSRIL